jgi:predicted ester cyclase
MSLEENKELVLRLQEEFWNEGDEGVADALLEPNLAARFKEGRRAWQQISPDFQSVVEDVVAEGDRVVIRVSGRGSHYGPMLGIPPTGKQLVWREISIFRIEKRQIVEYWSIGDRLGMVSELGATVNVADA